MNWAGFSGTDEQLEKWLKDLKQWSLGVGRRRRRSDMAEDIEGKAIEILVESSLVGSALTSALEARVAKALDLNDSFSTSRDSDLGAGLEDFEGSYLESFVVDASTENQEDTVISLIDRQPITEEGRDFEEIEDEITKHRRELHAIEDQVLTLRHLFGYTTKEIARYLGVSVSYAYVVLRRSRERMKGIGDLVEINARIQSDPNFTKLEVEWLAI